MRWLSPYPMTTLSASCSRGSDSRETLKHQKSLTLTVTITVCRWSRSTTAAPTRTLTHSVSLYLLSSRSTAPRCRITHPAQEGGVQARLRLHKHLYTLRSQRKAAQGRPESLHQGLVRRVNFVRGSAALHGAVAQVGRELQVALPAAEVLEAGQSLETPLQLRHRRLQSSKNSSHRKQRNGRKHPSPRNS